MYANIAEGTSDLYCLMSPCPELDQNGMYPSMQVEIARPQNIVVKGHHDGTSINVRSKLKNPSFIVNHGHLRVERVQFRGPLVEEASPDPLVRGVLAIDNRDELQLSMSRWGSNREPCELVRNHAGRTRG